MTKESLTPGQLADCQLLIIASPQTSFVEEEIGIVKEYVNKGGSLAIFSSEEGLQSPESNLNDLICDFGICIEKTTVVRATYHKYLHPKQALIQNGIVQPEIGVEKFTPLNTDKRRQQSLRQTVSSVPTPGIDPSMSLSFVYPNGTTLGVQTPAYTLLTSGSTSYPVDCPIAAAWESTTSNITDNNNKQGGRVLVVGSSDMFADDWLNKEENSQLCDVLLRYLLGQNCSFDPSVGRSDFEGKECVPDISSLSALVKPCLQENDPLPQDYRDLLCDDLFGLHNDYVTNVIDLYKQLNVNIMEPITLVEPYFECPTPPLRMSTHPPRWVDPPPPALELFDLDENLSDVRVRLARLTNQYKDDSNLDPYLQEVTRILGLDVNDVGGGRMAPNNVLFYIGEQVGLPVISLSPWLELCVIVSFAICTHKFRLYPCPSSCLSTCRNLPSFLFVNITTHLCPDLTSQARIVPHLLFTIDIIRFSLVIITNIEKE